MTEVLVLRIAAGGDGVGRLEDGMAVFVPRTAPGDVVEVEVTERRKTYARARMVRLVTSGEGRTEPSCPHYVGDQCGGCQLQHLDADTQRDVKRAIVGDALRRIGRRAVNDPAIVPSPLPWRYRRRLALAAAQGRVGFHRVGQPDLIFDLDECHLACEAVGDFWRRLRAQRNLFPERLESVTLREDRRGGLHAVFATAGSPVWDASPLAAALGADEVSLWWRPKGGAARVVAGPALGYPVLAFEQVHPAFGDQIRNDAIGGLGDVGGKVVWDLYGGVGDTARSLAAAGAEVWTVDADRRAVEWGRAQDVDGQIHWVTGLAEDVLPRLPQPDAVVTNPPRTGMAKSVSEALNSRTSARPGSRVAYISCDPATLARDLGRMPGLTVVSVAAYDLFPQTCHVEMVSVLEAA